MLAVSSSINWHQIFRLASNLDACFKEWNVTFIMKYPYVLHLLDSGPVLILLLFVTQEVDTGTGMSAFSNHAVIGRQYKKCLLLEPLFCKCFDY